MTRPTFYFTDVFTQSRYGGNQLATFYHCDHLSDAEMQQIAREINFSETTFIAAVSGGEDAYSARIFTPTAEIPFAGHPTLGTAYVLRNKILQSKQSSLTLRLKVGDIPVEFVEKENAPAEVWMRQMSPSFGKQLDAAQLADVLSLEASDFSDQSPIEEVSTGFPALIVPLKNLASVRKAKINLAHYHQLVDDAWAKLILLYSPEAYEAHQQLSVRVFAPYYGVFEDAATGSANGCLAAYLVKHELYGSQINLRTGQGYEMNRPSTILLNAHLAGSDIDVRVGGSVVDVASGQWGG